MVRAWSRWGRALFLYNGIRFCLPRKSLDAENLPLRPSLSMPAWR